MQNKVIKHFKVWNAAAAAAIKILHKSNKPVKILVEQNRNLGDTLHLIPIIRHYRILHPDAIIMMIVAQPYENAWAYNEDLNSIITVPKLNPQQRIAFRKELLKHESKIKVIAPSIFPYGAVWPELAWSHKTIADQYLHNAGIKDLKPLGGRRLKINLTEHDLVWVNKFVKKHGINRKNTVGFEYHSYSHQPTWRMSHFKELVDKLHRKKIKCISFAAPKESLIAGTIDLRGLSWRCTTAIMNHMGVFCGIGSGLTMVAASAETQPNIVELAVSDSITMKACGYANSVRVGNDVNQAYNTIVNLLARS